MSLSFKIALRFLKSSFGQTILISLGIAIGVSVQIFIGLLINGLQSGLIDKTIGNSPQISLKSKNEDKYIKNWNDEIVKLNQNKDVKNISIALDNPVFIKTGAKSESVLLRGLDIDKSDKILNLKDRIKEGSSNLKDNEVLIGKELKDELNLNINDYITLITPSNKTKVVKIVGVFDLKVSNLNKTWLITSLNTSQKLFDLANVITSIDMQVDKIFEADLISKNIEANVDKDIEVLNWKAQNEQLLSGLSGQSISSIMIQVFVLIAVVLGIASVLAISVLQKSKQIGILKAMGITNYSSSMIFLYQGLLLGVIGAVFGLIFGVGLLKMFTTFAKNPDGTPVIKIIFDTNFILLSALIAVVSSSIASLIPAIRSAKLNPMEVIKNG